MNPRETLERSDALIAEGVRLFLQEHDIALSIGREHTEHTPLRYVRALRELTSGAGVDARSVLRTEFEEDGYDQMIVVKDIAFTSLCAHHLLPFIGAAHFAYLPDKRIVGLSKIARLIDVLSRRPQVQERLTQEVVNIFYSVVQPKGCALVMEANHLCMSIRGVRKTGALTKTIALMGIYRDDPSAKAEFLEVIK